MNLTREKYENGLVDFTDVATAEQNLLNAQTALAASNAEILQYITAFYKATGGGYNLQIIHLCGAVSPQYSGFAPVNYLQKILLKYPYAVHVTEKPQTAFNQG